MTTAIGSGSVGRPEAIVYETHLHTPLCRHAGGSIDQYVATAQARNLKGITITCHNPLPAGYSQEVRMYLEQFPEYLRLVEQARQKWAGRLDIRLGLECDFVTGLKDWIKTQTESAKFDYLLGSIHPQTPEYWATYWHGDVMVFYRSYFANLALTAESGLFDCISHPDVVKNIWPSSWGLKSLLPDITAALDRIAATGIAMELNTSGLTKEIPEMNPSPRILKEMCRRGIPVVVGADAHMPDQVGRWFEQAYALLEKAGYKHISYFIERKRQDLPLAKARASLTAAAETKKR